MICGLSACMNNTFVHSSAKELCSHIYRHVMYYDCKNTYTFVPVIHSLYMYNIQIICREHGNRQSKQVM